MTRANRYWLYHGTQQPDGQSGHQLLGRFPTLISGTVACPRVGESVEKSGGQVVAHCRHFQR